MIAVLSWNELNVPRVGVMFFPRGSDPATMLKYVLGQKDACRKVVVYEITSLDEQPEEITS